MKVGDLIIYLAYKNVSLNLEGYKNIWFAPVVEVIDRGDWKQPVIYFPNQDTTYPLRRQNVLTIERLYEDISDYIVEE